MRVVAAVPGTAESDGDGLEGSPACCVPGSVLPGTAVGLSAIWVGAHLYRMGGQPGVGREANVGLHHGVWSAVCFNRR